MALGVPRLDQLITQLDSISGKFDSDDDLNKLEFTKAKFRTVRQLCF